MYTLQFWSPRAIRPIVVKLITHRPVNSIVVFFFSFSSYDCGSSVTTVFLVLTLPVSAAKIVVVFLMM